jgi:hypothetical protein
VLFHGPGGDAENRGDLAAGLARRQLDPSAWRRDRPPLGSELLDEADGMIDARHRDDLRGDLSGHVAIRRIGEHRADFSPRPFGGELVAFESAPCTGRGERVGVAALARW